MPASESPSIVLIGFVFLLVAVAIGVGGGTTGDKPDGDTLVRTVVNGHGEFDTLRGTLVSELEIHPIPAEHPPAG